MNVENIQRITLNLTDILKAKLPQGLHIPVPPKTVEVVIHVEGPLVRLEEAATTGQESKKGNGNGHDTKPRPELSVHEPT